MFKKCKIFLLPSTKESNIGLYKNKLYNSTFGAKTDDWINQNLYVLSEEKVKKGDWFMRIHFMGVPIDGIPEIATKYVVDNQSYLGDYIMKIIATTDSFITGYDDDGQPMDKSGNIVKQYPSIPQLFINIFVDEYNKGNQIYEIMVEYGYNFKGNFDNINSKKENNIKIDLKNNTITIKLVEKTNMNDELVIEYESGTIIRMMRWGDVYTLQGFIDKFLINKGIINSVTILKEKDKRNSYNK